jgi:hypothetical protein
MCDSLKRFLATAETELRQKLRQAGFSGPGMKSTFNALWRRDALRIRYESLGRHRVLSVQITEVGRRLAQQ